MEEEKNIQEVGDYVQGDTYSVSGRPNGVKLMDILKSTLSIVPFIVLSIIIRKDNLVNKFI